MRQVGDDVRERRLTRAWWPRQDHRRQTISLNGATQQFPRPEDVFLADELFERARPQAGGERRG